MNAIHYIETQDDFDSAVGRTIFYCQCIEHDIKSIYYGMVADMSDEEFEQSKKWTLGKTIDRLERLDNSDGKPYFSQSDYDLLRDVTSLRNYYAHQCYVEWVYNEQGHDIQKAFQKASNRLINDHNRLLKLHENIQTVRIRFHSDK